MPGLKSRPAEAGLESPGTYAGRNFSSAAYAQAAPTEETHAFVIFIRGAAVGREEVITRRGPEGTTISGSGRVAPPLDTVTQSAAVQYGADGTPKSLALDATVQGHSVAIRTSFNGTQALSETTEDGRKVSQTHTVSLKTSVVPNLFFGTYAMLASRIVNAAPGNEFPVYIAPQLEVPARVRGVFNESVQAGATVFAVKRFELGIANPGGDVLMHLTADAAGRLIRLMVPAQALDVVREDVAAANARISTFANPGDESVTIPSTGFNIAATLTRPKGSATRLPAVVLLSGQGATDRDSVLAGVPVMAQIAGALADAGIVSIRFDKRGYGQSGGRSESATLNDVAEDARTVVKYLADRKFVDPKRIAVLGHADGAWVALLTAGREGKVNAVVLIGAPASTGAEFVLEQQERQLDWMKVSGADRQAKIELQKQINNAALTGQGWDKIPREYRRADTPWLQSFLKFDPARALKDVDQPILIVGGELDREVPVAHVDRLAGLARTVSDSKSVEVVTVRGVNHLLVPATNGEVSEYGTLVDRTVSKDVTSSITSWLSKTLVAR
jgi:uncharacterized protein